VCYLKGLVSIYFRCLAKTEFLWNMPLLVCLQPAKLSDAQALPTSWLGGARENYNPVVTCTRRQSICYPYSWHPLQAHVPLNLNVMACHILKRTQVDPLLYACPEFNLSKSASPIKLKSHLLHLDLNTDWRQYSAHKASQHCSLLTVV